MSKIFRIPGLRVGFLLAPVGLIHRFEKFILPWSVNALAQEAVKYLLENKDQIQSFLEKSRAFVDEEKRLFLESLKPVKNIKAYPCAVYFVLARLTGSMTAGELCHELLKHRILIRNCANFEGLGEHFVRFSLKDRDTNMTLARRISELLS